MASSTGTLQMHRLHPRFGVELSGVDLCQPLDDGTWAHIWEAFNEHSLLVFHDQPLTDDEQMRFSERFGPLETTVKTLGKEAPASEPGGAGQRGRGRQANGLVGQAHALPERQPDVAHRLVLQAGAGPGIASLRPPRAV